MHQVSLPAESLLTIRQAVELTGRTDFYIRRAITRGCLPAQPRRPLEPGQKGSRRVFIAEADLIAWVRRSEEGTTCEQGNFLTIEEALDRTGVTRAILTHAIKRQVLPTHTLRLRGAGHVAKVLLAESDLSAWMATREEARARARQKALRTSSAPPPKPWPSTQRNSPEWASLLRRTRESQRLSRKELALRAGLDGSYMSLMEKGMVPRRDKVLALAQALEVDPNSFLAICRYALENTASTQWLVSLTPDEQRQVMEVSQLFLAAPADQRQSLLTRLRQGPEAAEIKPRERGQRREKSCSGASAAVGVDGPQLALF